MIRQRPADDPGNSTAPQDPRYRDVPRLWDLWVVRVDENGNIIYDADGDPVCEPDFFDRGLLKQIAPKDLEKTDVYKV